MNRVLPSPSFAGLMSLGFVFLGVFGVPALEPPEYTLQDITNWTEPQKAAIPYFHHYLPVAPPGAATNFIAESRTPLGTIVGYLDSTTSAGDTAVYLAGQSIYHVPNLGAYYWERLYWDGTDWHFQNGYVRFSRFFDVNLEGIAVGESTVTGRGESSIAWGSVAVLYDPVNGASPITEEHERGAATGINNNGEIAGWVSPINGQLSAFRRSPSGVLTILGSLGGSTKAVAINDSGLIVGESYATNLSRFRAVAFPPNTSTPINLDVPPTGPSDASSAYDLNGAGWICGASWEQAQSYEHFAALWIPLGGNQWESFDLNEITITDDNLLENAVAINESGLLIVRGRPDGSDLFGSHLYLLSLTGGPTVEPDVWVIR